jgi:hypothetical protein
MEKQLPALPDISVNFTPASIVVNIDELKAALTAQVEEQSNTVVTVENLQEGKKLAAEMNKVGAAIKRARIDYAKQAGVNITAFENQMKELEQISAAGVAKINEQVARFELETKEKAKQALIAALLEGYEKSGVNQEFKTATIDDLVSLSTLTKTGNLSGAAKNAIGERVAQCLAMQMQTMLRLSQLENRSYQSGLAAPLNRGHVEMFLFASDDEYEIRLAALFATEIQREQMAQAAMQKRAEEDRQRNAAAEAARIAAEQRAAQQAEQNRIMQEQHAEQLRLQQEQFAAQQAAMIEQQQQAAQAPAPKPAYIPELSQNFVVSPVLQAKTNGTRLECSDSEALVAALEQAKQTGSAELWRKAQPAELVAIVLTGAEAIAYRNQLKAGA